MNFFSKNTSTYLSSLSYFLSLNQEYFRTCSTTSLLSTDPISESCSFLHSSRIIAPEGRRGVAIKQNRLADLMIPEATWQQISPNLPIIVFISLSYRTHFYYSFLSLLFLFSTLLFHVMTFFSSGNLFCFFPSFDFLVPRCNY